MRNLYVSDLKRILKDKLFMVTCILAGVFALINPVLSKALMEYLDIGDLLGNMTQAKSLFFSAFLPGDNLGLIMPILISIVVCKDFGQGTVRNKIISGKSRREIFFSHLFSAATVICGVMLMHGALTLAVSLCFFPYQETAFTLADLGYFLISLLFEMILYFAVSAIVTFFATVTKKTGICILLYLATAFGLSIIGAVFQVMIMFVDPSSTSYSVIEFVNALNIYTSNIIGAGVTYGAKDVIYILMSPTLIIAGCTLLGNRIFAKKNLK